MAEINLTDGELESAFCQEIGYKLRQRRRLLRITESGLAAEIGVHRNTIMRWEAGEQAIPLWMLLRAADVLQCNFLLFIPSKDYIWGAYVWQLQHERDRRLTPEEKRI